MTRRAWFSAAFLAVCGAADSIGHRDIAATIFLAAALVVIGLAPPRA